VVQEAFVRYWRNQRNLKGERGALLITSIRRAAIDLARSNNRRSAREVLSASDAERLFESTSPIDHRVCAIEAGLHRLPSSQREVLTLKIWGELTFDEIARELDIPHNTAASRYRYALAALRNEMNMAQMS
jgi:RNA polymerase sigma-70 factor (ECF subfamily)